MYLSKVKKSGIWYVYYRKENRNKTRRSTGTKIKREALLFLTNFEKHLHSKKLKPKITISQWKDEYLEKVKILFTAKSFTLSRNTVNKFVNHIDGDILMTDFEPSVAENYILSIYQRAKHSAALTNRILKAFFNKYKASYPRPYFPNPFQNIKLRIPQNNPVFITQQELEEILKKENVFVLKSIYQFAFYTGMRVSEINNLQWNDVDRRTSIINVRNRENFTTKSKRERVIPIGKVVSGILDKMDKSVDYVFANPKGTNYDGGHVSRRFKECVRQAGLNEKIHFHTLRHSFGSSLVQKGVSLYVIQKLLGHSSITTTQIYSHLRNEDLQNAIMILEN